MRVLGLGIRSLLLAAIGTSACAVDDRRFRGPQPAGESGVAPPGGESTAPVNGMAPTSAGGAGGNGVAAPGTGSGNAEGSGAAGMAGTPVPAAATPDAVAPAPVAAGSVGVTIGGERLNALVSTGVALYPEPGGSGQIVSGIEVGSAACFDNVDLTGIRSIDISFARDGRAVSSSARFAILWGSADVTVAENLGEKVTTDTGGWDIFQRLNVGLNRPIPEVGRLCFRGLQGSGILRLRSFSLRDTPGTNDGVTAFEIPVPSGPAVPPIAVSGNQVLFGGQATSVAGNSFFWSNGPFGGDHFYTAEAVKWLKDDWGSQIVRAALAVDDNLPGGAIPLATLRGYLTHPFDNQFNVQKVVNAAIENGMYVIIDYHAREAEASTAQAVAFFREMASFYGGFNNVIYEVYSEPASADWPTIKAHGEAVIGAIRAIDPDNLVIVGTPLFSQDVQVAAADPINDVNVAYALHFHAASHGQDLRDRALQAMDAGIALFVTEWSTSDATGQDAPNAAATQAWMDFLRLNNISHTNWSISDLALGSAGLLRGASPLGGWNGLQLSPSGQMVQSIIAGW